ncbi:MAG: hypothetical protein IRZ11_06475 [Clostridia bacterium]|nr:hypothetical protein [Clostridia bacterium]
MIILAAPGHAGYPSSPAGWLAASWPKSYESVAEMATDASAVVVGTVTAIDAQTVADGGIPFTDFAFSVTQVLVGPPLPRTITLHQTGGVRNGGAVELPDDPLMRVGTRYVLFLYEFAPGRFYVLGGPQGRFVLDDEDRVWSLNLEVAAARGEGPEIAGMPLDAFRRLVVEH